MVSQRRWWMSQFFEILVFLLIRFLNMWLKDLSEKFWVSRISGKLFYGSTEKMVNVAIFRNSNHSVNSIFIYASWMLCRKNLELVQYRINKFKILQRRWWMLQFFDFLVFLLIRFLNMTGICRKNFGSFEYWVNKFIVSRIRW